MGKEVWTEGADGKWRNQSGHVRCPHGKRKQECIECGGSQVCQHRKLRAYCKVCKGSQVCEHGKQRQYCKECHGSRICQHGRNKSHCKECGGASFCHHGSIRSQCVRCKGGSICEHGRRRITCWECGGSYLCEHGRARSSCGVCQPVKALRIYRRNAKQRGYGWELTESQAVWLMKQKCTYCGRKVAGGIDRAKNEFGYTVLNSVPCCTTCNMAKHAHSIKAFLVAVNAVARYCPDYPQFKRRWTRIRNKLTQLGEQDAVVFVDVLRVRKTRRKVADLGGGAGSAVVPKLRVSDGYDAGCARVV
jgi:hypothetical protein